MLAVQGLYENGQVKLVGDKPEGNGEVLVIFNISKENDEKGKIGDVKKQFDRYTGCIHRQIDDKAERLEALDEKNAVTH